MYGSLGVLIGNYIETLFCQEMKKKIDVNACTVEIKKTITKSIL